MSNTENTLPLTHQFQIINSFVIQSLSTSIPMSNTYNLQQQELSTSTIVNDLPTDVAIQVEQLEERQRRVLAKILIPASLEQVWQVLTDYNTCAEFLPNLTESRRLQLSTKDIQIEQVRTKNFMGMNFSARSLFNVQEKFPHSIHYQQIEGDMKSLSGYWQLKPHNLANGQDVVELIYDFTICPKRIFPMALVEHILSNDIPANMLAIRQRVEDIYLCS